MKKFHVIPKDRDATAKLAYKVLNQLLRRHAPELETMIDKAWKDLITTGTAIINVAYDQIEKDASDRISRQMDSRSKRPGSSKSSTNNPGPSTDSEG